MDITGALLCHWEGDDLLSASSIAGKWLSNRGYERKPNNPAGGKSDKDHGKKEFSSMIHLIDFFFSSSCFLLLGKPH